MHNFTSGAMISMAIVLSIVFLVLFNLNCVYYNPSISYNLDSDNKLMLSELTVTNTTGDFTKFEVQLYSIGYVYSKYIANRNKYNKLHNIVINKIPYNDVDFFADPKIIEIGMPNLEFNVKTCTHYYWRADDVRKEFALNRGQTFEPQDANYINDMIKKHDNTLIWWNTNNKERHATIDCHFDCCMYDINDFSPSQKYFVKWSTIFWAMFVASLLLVYILFESLESCADRCGWRKNSDIILSDDEEIAIDKIDKNISTIDYKEQEQALIATTLNPIYISN
jgi:hypothetical protein